MNGHFQLCIIVLGLAALVGCSSGGPLSGKRSEKRGAVHNAAIEHRRHGFAHLARAQFAKAEASFLALSKTNPEQGQVYTALARIHQGKYISAYKDLERTMRGHRDYSYDFILGDACAVATLLGHHNRKAVRLYTNPLCARHLSFTNSRFLDEPAPKLVPDYRRSQILLLIPKPGMRGRGQAMLALRALELLALEAALIRSRFGNEYRYSESVAGQLDYTRELVALALVGSSNLPTLPLNGQVAYEKAYHLIVDHHREADSKQKIADRTEQIKELLLFSANASDRFPVWSYEGTSNTSYHFDYYRERRRYDRLRKTAKEMAAKIFKVCGLPRSGTIIEALCNDLREWAFALKDQPAEAFKKHEAMRFRTRAAFLAMSGLKRSGSVRNLYPKLDSVSILKACKEIDVALDTLALAARRIRIQDIKGPARAQRVAPLIREHILYSIPVQMVRKNSRKIRTKNPSANLMYILSKIASRRHKNGFALREVKLFRAALRAARDEAVRMRTPATARQKAAVKKIQVHLASISRKKRELLGGLASREAIQSSRARIHIVNAIRRAHNEGRDAPDADARMEFLMALLETGKRIVEWDPKFALQNIGLFVAASQNAYK